MTPEDEKLKRLAKRKNDQEMLAADLAVAIGRIQYWQTKQKERWAEHDPKRAKICGEIITLYQKEAGQINRKLASWA